jgi:hypothetical protein
MSYRSYGLLTAMAALAIATSVAPAQALSMKECSAKYKAAQTAGTLGGMKWNDFRKVQCGSDAAATPAAAPATTTAAAPAAPKSTSSKTTAAARAASKPAPTTMGSAPAAAAGDAVFPTAVSPKYASLSAGKARMQTCLDQYKANKADNGNGNLKWIEKGGGYYSECNKRLSAR